MGTLINIVLDKSGSMGVVRDATIDGFNELLETHKRDNPDANLSLMLFDTSTSLHYEDAPVGNVVPLTPAQYVPDGNTALYDAIGQSIRSIERRTEQPDRVAFVIITDGQENSSVEYKQRQIFDLITWHQNEGKGWEFTFLGANMDSYAVGGSLGVPHLNTMNYNQTPAGTQAVFVAAASSTSGYLRGTKSNLGYDSKTRTKVESTK